MTIDDAHHPRKSKSRHRHRNSESGHRHGNGSHRRCDCKSFEHADRSKTINQFCKQHGIGRSTYYDLRKKGLGPVEMRVLGTVRISAQANRDWVQKMETGVARPVPPLADVKLEDSEKCERSDETKKSDEVVARKSREHKKRRERRPHRHGRTERRRHNRRHAGHRRDPDKQRDLDLD